MAETLSTQDSPDVKRILFVDDEQYLLDGLRDALRPFRRQWKMKFVAGGEDALAELHTGSYNVVVSDLRMPSMDGATLLGHVRDVSPNTVRIVLSGHAELRMVARAAGVAHQLLSKPCETDHLVRVIERSCAIQEMSARVELNRRAVSASALPSAPSLHLRLTEAFSSGQTSADDVARIVERDLAMAAKVLQLANSAYFGRRQPVTKLGEAVAFLGMETLHALVLQTEGFSSFPVQPPIEGFDLDRLQRHCYRVGHLARALLAETHRADAYTAGLLHDIGLLILATHERETLAAILESAARQRRPIYEVERELCSVTHAEIGAHLLALWGLPLSVTTAVSCHHDPVRTSPVFDEVAATYLANILVEEAEVRGEASAVSPAELDEDYLRACGVLDRMPHWRELAQSQVERSR